MGWRPPVGEERTSSSTPATSRANRRQCQGKRFGENDCLCPGYMVLSSMRNQNHLRPIDRYSWAERILSRFMCAFDLHFMGAQIPRYWGPTLIQGGNIEEIFALMCMISGIGLFFGIKDIKWTNTTGMVRSGVDVLHDGSTNPNQFPSV